MGPDDKLEWPHGGVVKSQGSSWDDLLGRGVEFVVPNDDRWLFTLIVRDSRTAALIRRTMRRAREIEKRRKRVEDALLRLAGKARLANDDGRLKLVKDQLLGYYYGMGLRKLHLMAADRRAAGQIT